MGETAVFECGICFSVYDNGEHLPLSLPCGHVYCKACMTSFCPGDKIMCPADKAVHNISVERLPCCFAILSNLPRSPVRTREVCCPKHPKKKIKFQCRVHSLYLCSNCVIDHTGAGHDVVTFSVTYEQMKRESDSLYTTAQRLFTEAREAAQAKLAQEKRMKAFYQQQIQKVANTFDAAIRKLTTKKSELIDTLTFHQKDQQKSLDQHKTKVNKTLEAAQKLSEEVKALSEHIEDKTYEEFTRAINVKKQELKVLTEFRPKAEPEAALFTYREGALLGDMGSLVEVKPEAKEEDEGWTCTRCAILNRSNRETCEACCAPPMRTIETFDDDSWKCRNCGCSNPRNVSICYRCRQQRGYDFGTSQGAETARYGYSPSGKAGKDDLRPKPTAPSKAALMCRNKVAAGGRKRAPCKKRNNSF